MEKILKAIGSGLKIRFTEEEQSEKYLNGILNVRLAMFNRRDVSEEVRTLFEDELRKHLLTKLKEIKVGESVEYGFEYGNVRPLGTLMEDVNDNLAEVLLKLPQLKDGESYEFPCETYIYFTLLEIDEEGALVKPYTASEWIKEACEKL